ncbi:erythromycin esterase family protein [Pseudotenacibaculum haliotis]|uniref:Erythromycin esterase family protein n=1 Tax=Pseudotenacibaculum haliotis TaxID=1862138 RepID=A0ABW5LU02_9FLAO
MKKTIIIWSVLIITIHYSCSQEQANSTEWLNKNTIELESNDLYDFSGLKDILKDKKIVAIGESNHGLGKFYEMKSALVMYLHKELGFEILAMEGGLGDINLAYEDIDTISPKNLRDHTLFGNFKAKEVDTLFNYIKATSTSERPLIYTGYDTQFSSSYLITKLMRLLKPLDKTLSDSLPSRIYSFQKQFQASYNKDSIGYLKHRDIYIKNAKDISKLLEAKRDELLKTGKLNKKQYLIIQKTMEMFIKSTNLNYEDRNLSYGLRDQLMAEILIWLLEEIYPNKKVIVWAHNAHIEKDFVENYNVKLMGHYLKERYQDDYYSIGLFAYEGKAYEHWTRNSVPFKNDDSLSIEKRLWNTGKELPFLEMSRLSRNPSNSWLFEINKGFELENGRMIRFIPTKRFDGIISIRSSEIPTYD